MLHYLHYGMAALYCCKQYLLYQSSTFDGLTNFLDRSHLHPGVQWLHYTVQVSSSADCAREALSAGHAWPPQQD